jgi:hypothetical protein
MYNDVIIRSSFPIISRTWQDSVVIECHNVPVKTFCLFWLSTNVTQDIYYNTTSCHFLAKSAWKARYSVTAGGNCPYTPKIRPCFDAKNQDHRQPRSMIHSDTAMAMDFSSKRTYKFTRFIPCSWLSLINSTSMIGNEVYSEYQRDRRDSPDQSNLCTSGYEQPSEWHR